MGNKDQLSDEQKAKQISRQKVANAAFGWCSVCYMLIFCIPVFNDIYVRKEAKKHPNTVQKIANKGVLVKDIKDGKERVLGIKCFSDSADVQNYLKQGDTLYVFSQWYNDKSFFEYDAKIIGIRDSIKARKEREKIQQIINSSNTKQR